MSLQGPIIVAADSPVPAVLDCLSSAGAFPVIEACRAELFTAIDQVEPAAIVLAGPSDPQDASTVSQALEAASRLSRAEGLIPALESAHAVAEAIRQAPAAKDEIFIVNLSGRGDKDIDIYRENFPELDSE